MMICSMCENKKPLKKTRITHKYKESGLHHVVLIGVEHYRCNDCGEEYFGYSNLEKLNQAITGILIQKKGFLTGQEVRFLRKHMGYSGTLFAKLIGYDHDTVTKIERGAQPVTRAFDRLVRFAIASKVPDRNYDLHDQLLMGEGIKLDRIELTLVSHGDWKLKAA